MALIEIDGLPGFTCLKWWIFPWRTVSHNQRVIAFQRMSGNFHGLLAATPRASGPRQSLSHEGLGALGDGRRL